VNGACAREGWRRFAVRTGAVALIGLGLALPALALWLDALRHSLGPDPWAEASRRSGSWALVFLVASLAVTPLRQTLRLAALAPMRRVIGLTAFAYAVLHMGIHLGSIGGGVRRFLAELISQRNLAIGRRPRLEPGCAAVHAFSLERTASGGCKPGRRRTKFSQRRRRNRSDLYA
jgi:DMSO/TMAO reductase YedYZ heme-binding membrane subunit